MSSGSDRGEIELIKLGNGTHEFRFEFGKAFFEQFENSSFSDGSIKAHLILHKTESVFNAKLDISGSVEATCDYCLEGIHLPLQNSLDFIIKLSDVKREDNEEKEIYYVLESDSRFNIGKYVYDLIFVALPLQKTCEKPGELDICNKDMIGKLNELKHKDENAGEEKGDTDPRWDKLKDLLN